MLTLPTASNPAVSQWILGIHEPNINLLHMLYYKAKEVFLWAIYEMNAANPYRNAAADPAIAVMTTAATMEEAT